MENRRKIRALGIRFMAKTNQDSAFLKMGYVVSCMKLDVNSAVMC